MSDLEHLIKMEIPGPLPMDIQYNQSWALRLEAISPDI